MRIALVITELDTGGAESCLTELAIFLAAGGCEVRVLAIGPPPVPPRDALVARLRAANIDVRFGQARGLGHLPRALGWLRRELLDFDPDIVQSMLWHANVLAAAALGRHRARLVGGMRVSEPRRWRWPIERRSARRMARIVCVSDDVRVHALCCERLPSDKLVTIPNGVALSTLESTSAGDWSELNLAQPEHVLLFVGRLEPQKGVVELARNFPAMLNRLPDWQSVVIGQGSLQAPVQRLVEQAGLEHRVHLVPWQPRVARWMLASDILLLPAAYEGMPNVLLEAMGLGRPFVAFAVDGVRQLLAAGVAQPLADAQLAPPGDWPAFRQRVERLASDAFLRDQCGLANRQQVAAHFRLEDQLAKYATLYRELLAP